MGMLRLSRIPDSDLGDRLNRANWNYALEIFYYLETKGRATVRNSLISVSSSMFNICITYRNDSLTL